jgi:bifunctional non-homologous end joining protein LigD
MAEKKRYGAAKRLAAYKAKRNFGSTPEPSGDGKPKRPPTGTNKRQGKHTERYFCVQKHLASHLHYDFRLEHDGALLSWAVPRGPSLNPKDKRLAMRVEDHPLDYGEFEGVIPEGYGAGIVLLWDRGTWEPQPPSADVDDALRKGELKFRLDGVKLKGSWVLVRTGGRGGDGRTWLLIKHRDEWAGDVDVIGEFPLSVKNFGDFEDILAEKTPDVWESHRPARGGAAGEMLQRIIDKAAALKAGDEKKGAAAKPAAKPRPAKAATTAKRQRPAPRRAGARRPATRAGAKR